MFSISSFSKKLVEKLRRKPYRDAYVSEHVRRGISAQIRAMRDQRGWSQGKLSELLGKPQSVVSRLEDPNYGKVTVQTLLEVASTLDVALSIRFVSFPTFITQTRDLTSASMRVDSFDIDAMAGTQTVFQQPREMMLTAGLNALSVWQSALDHSVSYSTKAVSSKSTDIIWRTVPLAVSEVNAGSVYIQPNTEVMGRA